MVVLHQLSTIVRMPKKKPPFEKVDTATLFHRHEAERMAEARKLFWQEHERECDLCYLPDSIDNPLQRAQYKDGDAHDNDNFLPLCRNCTAQLRMVRQHLKCSKEDAYMHLARRVREHYSPF